MTLHTAYNFLTTHFIIKGYNNALVNEWKKYVGTHKDELLKLLKKFEKAAKRGTRQELEECEKNLEQFVVEGHGGNSIFSLYKMVCGIPVARNGVSAKITIPLVGICVAAGSILAYRYRKELFKLFTAWRG